MCPESGSRFEPAPLPAELIATLSHELRSPLTVIQGYAATLLRAEHRLPRAERREFLEAIGEASNRLDALLNRLLELAQLELGSVALHVAQVDLLALVREALAETARQALSRQPESFAFGLQIAPELSAAPSRLQIEADARLLRRVLDNLLDNAVKYSPEGGAVDVEIRPFDAARNRPLPEVQVSAGAPLEAAGGLDSDAPELLEITVRDHGRGIPADQLSRIFERFHRVDTRLARDVDGLGLGLATCKQIVELHGGVIWAESTPGAGSCLHLVLPPVPLSARQALAALPALPSIAS